MRVRLAFLAAVMLTACSGPPARPASVVILLVDTLRADHLGCYGYTRATSPALDRWAERGALFERAFASSPWTLPSVGSILTGRPPSRHGAGRLVGAGGSRGFTRMDAKLPALADLLRKRGFATAAIANNAMMAERLGVARGFERYDFFPSKGTKIRRADETTDLALAWLDARDGVRPFLLLVHFFDPHMAYDPAPEVRGRFTGDTPADLELPVSNALRIRMAPQRVGPAERAFITAAYDEEVAFVGSQVARLLAGLRERGLTDRSLVLFTADHGEELFDHEGFEHGHTAYQELLHVPLLFWGAAVRAASFDVPVSHVDLLPTILDALGLPLPGALPGVSLWPLLTRGEAPLPRALVAEGMLYGPARRAWIRWPFKLIVTSPGPADPVLTAPAGAVLFDLASDPRERHDLAPARPEQTAALRRELEAHIAGDAPAREKADVEPWRAHLRSLGYLE